MKNMRFIGLHRQRGFNLIEILVALFIALFLLGGLLMIEQNVRSAQSSQTGLTQLQDEERLAMSMLNDVIQIAGYYPDPTTNSSSSFPAFTTNGTAVSLAKGQMIGAVTGSGATPSDTIVVRYMTSGTDQVIDCVGSTGAAGIFTNVFSVNAANQLDCSIDGGNTTVHLINGVTQLTALYGVSTNPSTPNDVDTYYTAAQVPNWNNVIAVKVTVTFQNPLSGQPGNPVTVPPTVSFSRVIGLQSHMGIIVQAGGTIT